MLRRVVVIPASRLKMGMMRKVGFRTSQKCQESDEKRLTQGLYPRVLSTCSPVWNFPSSPLRAQMSRRPRTGITVLEKHTGGERRVQNPHETRPESHIRDRNNHGSSPLFTPRDRGYPWSGLSHSPTQGRLISTLLIKRWISVTNVNQHC